MENTTRASRLAPAKINLYLEVSARRLDGYHDIESVMQTVTLFDTVTLEKRITDGGGIIIECTREGIPLDEKNLVYRAAKLFFEKTEITERDVTVTIDKRIPMAAGLGGGSSDAATMLILLDELYGTDMSEDELCSLGAKIGADVPFLIKQGISVTRGIGDEFSPCDRLPDCFIVIALAGEGVSTPWAYGRLDEMYDFEVRKVSADKFTKALSEGKIEDIAGQMTNIFESVVLPERRYARLSGRILDEVGALRVMMSGSGPSMLGIFTDEKTAKDAVSVLTREGVEAYLTKPYYPDN